MEFFDLNLNLELFACHFQYQVEIFFKIIVIDGSLVKAKYHVIRVEFQFLVDYC